VLVIAVTFVEMKRGGFAAIKRTHATSTILFNTVKVTPILPQW